MSNQSANSVVADNDDDDHADLFGGDDSDVSNGAGARKLVTGRRRRDRSQQTVLLVVSLIISDEGRALRRYIVQQYLLNGEINWRRKIDRMICVPNKHTLTNSGEGRGPEGGGGVAEFPLVKETKNVWEKAATRCLDVQVTERALTDVEARVWTRSFFQWTPLIKREFVIMRPFLGVVLPLLRTAVGLLSY